MDLVFCIKRSLKTVKRRYCACCTLIEIGNESLDFERIFFRSAFVSVFKGEKKIIYAYVPYVQYYYTNSVHPKAIYVMLLVGYSKLRFLKKNPQFGV